MDLCKVYLWNTDSSRLCILLAEVRGVPVSSGSLNTPRTHCMLIETGGVNSDGREELP